MLSQPVMMQELEGTQHQFKMSREVMLLRAPKLKLLRLVMVMQQLKMTLPQLRKVTELLNDE